VITKFRNNENFKGKTESGKVMHDVIQRFYEFPLGKNRKIAEELLFLDITRVLNGFDYERIIQENSAMGTLSEYMEFGAVTPGFRILLDIDIALYPHTLNPCTIRNLRKAYKWFGLAFKLSSDIATFEREYFVEKSLNAVIIYGQEIGVLPERILQAEREYKEQFCEDVIPSLMGIIEKKGRAGRAINR